MLDYPTLANKPQVTLYKDGEKYEMVDLLSKVYNGKMDIYGNTFVVTKEYVARPDLISNSLYGTDMFGDLICKVNGISNPFELNENMVIFAPLKEFLSAVITKMGPRNELVSKSKLNSNGTTDNIFKEFSTSMLSNEKLKEELSKDLKNKKNTASTIGKDLTSNKKLKNERRTPGEQTIDDVNYVIDKSLGIVIY